jgi:RNA polymerase sigma factor for flagellar operon FliA
MYDRQFLSPLHAAASTEGALATRPANRSFAEAHIASPVEPIAKPGSGRSDLNLPDGSPPGADQGSQRGRDGGPPRQDDGALPIDMDVADTATDGIADVIDPLDAIDVDPAVVDGLPAGDPLLSDIPSEPVDLTGYGAYGQIPPPVVGLSRDQLVSKYAHLVKYVVGRLGVSVPGLFDHEDAMQAGVLGLLRAIDAYRPEAAASFESYAILRIRGSILDAVRSLDTVGRAGREAARAIQGAIRDLQHEMGRSPTESEIAARLSMPIARYRERLQAASVVTISLDEHDSRDSDDESNILADNAPDPNAVDPEDDAVRRDAIAGLVKEIGRLAQRPKMVLALYYQDEMTFKEIGQVLGVTESRVCQIHTEAILALRTRLVDPDVAARLGRRRARS